jgi:tetratricopeptide (TPR) repeat protein
MKRLGLSVLFILALVGSLKAQAGGNTLFGDVKVDESQAGSLKPLSLHVLLYSESGNLLFRQTVASNGRYRFIDLHNGRYDIVVEVEDIEVARVHVSLNSPFKTDIRQDIELSWRDVSERGRSGVLSVGDTYSRSVEHEALFSKATKATGKKHYDEAIGLLKKILNSDPADFPAWVEFGTACFIQKNFEEAENAYLRALKTHPNYPLALISLGRLRIVRKNFDGALEALSQAVKLQPLSAQANYFLGDVYLQLKLGSKAVPYLNEALRLDPVGMADAHLLLAALYNAKEMKDKAAAEYEMYLKKRPDSPDKEMLKRYIAAYRKP